MFYSKGERDSQRKRVGMKGTVLRKASLIHLHLSSFLTLFSHMYISKLLHSDLTANPSGHLPRLVGRSLARPSPTWEGQPCLILLLGGMLKLQAKFLL